MYLLSVVEREKFQLRPVSRLEAIPKQRKRRFHRHLTDHVFHAKILFLQPDSHERSVINGEVPIAPPCQSATSCRASPHNSSSRRNSNRSLPQNNQAHCARHDHWFPIRNGVDYSGTSCDKPFSCKNFLNSLLMSRPLYVSTCS